MRLTLLVLFGLIASCDAPEQQALHGRLYFAAGSYVGEFDLSDGSSAPVASLGDVTIDHVRAYEENDLLLTLRDFVNERETSRILRYDPRKNASFPLFPGLMAEFLPGPRVVIYDDGGTLLATHRAKAFRDEAVIDAHGYNSKPSVVVISDTEILFNSIVDGEVLIQRYDVDEGKSYPMHDLSKVCRLDGAVWIADSGVILCKAQFDSSEQLRYGFVSLNGTATIPLALPEDNNFRALIYLPDQNLVIFSESSSSWGGGQQKYAVWVYDTNASSAYRLAKDQYLGQSVVYRP
jgi:hypothetical protein